MAFCEHGAGKGEKIKKDRPVCKAPRKADPLPGAEAERKVSGGKKAGPVWPRDTFGQPEQAEMLIRMSDFGSAAEVTISMLRAFGVPVYHRYMGDGQLGKVILGFSGYGIELYVPQSMLKLAKELLKTSGEE
ncbi:MAG: hypothetical protein PHT34_06880 [Oscillospiraceae bacterium]|nr:hypothetical protein [Oscillospiraceae bacterium]